MYLSATIISESTEFNRNIYLKPTNLEILTYIKRCKCLSIAISVYNVKLQLINHYYKPIVVNWGKEMF